MNWISFQLLGWIIIALLVTIRQNMKPKVIKLWDKIMLRKRYIIETVNDQLKSISQIEHSRHRSMHGFMLNLMRSLIAYCHKEAKPTITIDDNDMKLLTIL
jgi:hypothetical protein